ncbi:MAG: cation:proton antiporter [Bacteroidales bacterium]|nr:cation:proton antiporter [Bacteroidales bacterium]MCF8390571.1 cation:proton antiporter [Bacteroidales bacterium]
MHSEFHLLQDIVIIFALASFVVWFFHKLKIPSIIGFLITGVLAGPHGLGLIDSTGEIEILAEIGVVLLLFTIGIEFSLKNLIKSRKLVFIGGSLQVFLAIGLTFLIARLAGRSPAESVFFGFLVALSSTAVVMKVLQERAEVNKAYGRFSLGVLIFQDLIIVPMILLIPLLTGVSSSIGKDIGILVLKVVVVLGFTYAGSKFLVPWMLHQVARTKSQELFLLTILMFVLAVALFTSSIGLSLALGAFLAGLIISESDYSHHAFGNVIPLRDIFMSFFFVSIGMLFDIGFVLENAMLVLLVVFVVLFLKTFISGLIAFIMGFPFRTTVLAGIALSQVGEFSFILAKLGSENSIIDQKFYQLFITISVLTMALTPFMIMFGPRISALLERLPLGEKVRLGLKTPVLNEEVKMNNHMVIIGMGLHGHNVAKAAKSAGIQYVILENDPDIVRKEKEKGESIYFGSASHEEVLKQCGVESAEVVVITPSNSTTVYRATELVREMNPKAHIIARIVHLEDMDDVYKYGANEVIPEEFETSVEIFSRVLAKYLIPRDEINKFIAELRSDSYQMFRSIEKEVGIEVNLNLHFPDLEISAIKIDEGSEIVGKNISGINLKSKFSVSIIAIRRGDENIINPAAKTILQPEDIVYIIGTSHQISCASSVFRSVDTTNCSDAVD